MLSESKFIKQTQLCKWIKYTQSMDRMYIERMLYFDLSPDGCHLAGCFYDKKRIIIEIYDIKRRALVHTLIGHLQAVVCLKYSPNGNFLLSGSKNGEIKIWDRKSYIEVLSGENPELHSIQQLQISPNGTQFATRHDHIIRIWCCITRNKLHEIVLQNPCIQFKYSTDEQHIITAQGEYFSIWEIRRNRLAKKLIGSPNHFHLQKQSSNGSFMVFGGFKGMLQMRNRRNGKILRVLYAKLQELDDYSCIDSISLSSQKMISMVQNELLLWDLRTAKNRIFHPNNQKIEIFEAKFSPDGRYAVVQTDQEYLNIQRLFHIKFKQ